MRTRQFVPRIIQLRSNSNSDQQDPSKLLDLRQQNSCNPGLLSSPSHRGRHPTQLCYLEPGNNRSKKFYLCRSFSKLCQNKQHRATKNTRHYAHGDELVPNIDRVIEEMWITPFTNRVASIRLHDVGKNKFPEYCGNTDPEADARAFRLTMPRAHLNDE